VLAREAGARWGVGVVVFVFYDEDYFVERKGVRWV